MNFGGDRKAFRGHAQDAASDIAGFFFGQSSFAHLVRAHKTSVINVSRLVKSEHELQVLAPLGCTIQTGAGTITELAKAGPSDKVAVIGLGGVGLSAIMAAKMKGCEKIIGIDRVPERVELAKTLGATHGIDTTREGSSLEVAIRKITEGTGTNITVETSGVVSLIQQGMEFTANQGKMILAGVPPADDILQVPIIPFMITGKMLMGSMEGAANPKEYIPQLIQWYHEGNFPLEKLVKYYRVEDFKTAFHDMEAGTIIKPILIW